MQSINNNTSYNTAIQSNHNQTITEYIIPKNSFEKKLATRAGLQQHISLLQNLYDNGIASNWENSIKTDICLLPKILWQIRQKYPAINLIILELGIGQLAFEVTKLINNNITSAKLVFGTDGLSMASNHFIMADYYLDTSAASNKASIVFFDAGSQNDNIRHMINRSSQINHLKHNFLIKTLYVSLDIQKSDVDCLLFSIELAKSAHKSVTEIRQLHLLNINNKLTARFTPEEECAIVATGKPLYKFDRYIPINMLKHCQSNNRINSYISVCESCGKNPTVSLNKKQESLKARCKRFTKNKKFAYFNKEIIASFSIEHERLRALKKIEQRWEQITDLSMTLNLD